MRNSHDTSDDYVARAEINVTPLVDVMLVLLVVFMITVPLLATGIPVKLPKTGAVTPDSPRAPIVVTISRDGIAFLGAEQIAPRDLALRIRDQQSEQPERTVYVRGDREAPYGRMVEVMAQLNAAGVTRISLVALSEPVPTPSTQ
ncbi:MAG: biopolymer transporter ExbD [Hyphomicrobiales bacterium]|nr:biopolymer transporter ExbD [Hyphomicrobiales bacterium]